ncbi:hypothetical protein [Adlercreutzia shanghongiae]|uniref:Uncharacterized protein n=1 Tax=Adlercreutzia shanghongiae TaxID=3111773 RepID=A0ABU6J002_9ACTN|nr:hypothetical protein [Adlercreutzia sp. R22]MEC4295398.1 hypothetical protein [Adlercreutzia sp. R22]
MQSLSTGLNALTDRLGPKAAAALKRSRNKERYRAAVERAWRGRPEVARLVLMHTNGIYIAKDERPRKGPDRDRDILVFGIYLDDAMVRTEVDSWQSVLLTALRQEGLSVEELRFMPAKWDMRQRRLFPELWEEDAGAMPERTGGRSLQGRDESRALDVVKRAVYLVFEDTEQAWAFLEQVRGASLDEVPATRDAGEGMAGEGCRQGEKRYWLTFYVDDTEAMKRLARSFGGAIVSRARRLGLRIRGISVRQAGPELAGMRTFQRQGASVPYRLLKGGEGS